MYVRTLIPPRHHRRVWLLLCVAGPLHPRRGRFSRRGAAQDLCYPGRMRRAEGGNCQQSRCGFGFGFMCGYMSSSLARMPRQIGFLGVSPVVLFRLPPATYWAFFTPMPYCIFTTQQQRLLLKIAWGLWRSKPTLDCSKSKTICSYLCAPLSREGYRSPANERREIDLLNPTFSAKQGTGASPKTTTHRLPTDARGRSEQQIVADRTPLPLQ